MSGKYLKLLHETVVSVDNEEEIAAEAKEDDLVADEAKERAQTMTVEEDTATAGNSSTNIIHKRRIKTVGEETNKGKNEKNAAEAKEEGHMAEEDGIRIQKMDAVEDITEIEESSTTTSHKSSRNDQPTKRLHKYTTQQSRAKATTAASITKFITTKYKHAADPWSAKLKQRLRITEGKEE